MVTENEIEKENKNTKNICFFLYNIINKYILIILSFKFCIYFYSYF